MSLSSQSKFPSFLLHTWDRLLYLVFFQEVLELYFKEGGLSFDKSSTIVKKMSSSLAMTSCLLTKITSEVFKYTSKKIAIRWILPPFECPHKLDWTRESNVWLSLLLGDLRSAERKTSKCASERTSLMQRKENNVLSLTKKNEKNAHTGHFWMHLLATTNNEYRRRNISQKFFGFWPILSPQIQERLIYRK